MAGSVGMAHLRLQLFQEIIVINSNICAVIAVILYTTQSYVYYLKFESRVLRGKI